MIKSGLNENFKSSIVAATGSTGHSAARRGDKEETWVALLYLIIVDR